MKTWKTALVIACVFGLTHLIWSQSLNENPIGSISRSLNSRTATLTSPTPGSTLSPEEIAALTTVSGTFVFKFTIKVLSTIPKNSVILCGAEPSVSESTTGISFTESASGIATFVSGSTWSCTATIHYSWALSTPSSDAVRLFGDALISQAYQLTAANSAATTVINFSSRVHNRTAGTLSSVPSGTTTVPISVTL
jgi:hypothetical protein